MYLLFAVIIVFITIFRHGLGDRMGLLSAPASRHGEKQRSPVGFVGREKGTKKLRSVAAQCLYYPNLIRFVVGPKTYVNLQYYLSIQFLILDCPSIYSPLPFLGRKDTTP